jgi:hypothetical protein
MRMINGLLWVLAYDCWPGLSGWGYWGWPGLTQGLRSGALNRLLKGQYRASETFIRGARGRFGCQDPKTPEADPDQRLFRVWLSCPYNGQPLCFQVTWPSGKCSEAAGQLASFLNSAWGNTLV